MGIKTDDELTAALKEHPNICPFCTSSRINASNHDNDSRDMSCSVVCEECGAGWDESYKFSEAFIEQVPGAENPSGLWCVKYRIVSGTTGKTISEGEQIVNGGNRRDAEYAAPEQIADLDPMYDGRLDPHIEIVEIEPATEDQINPEGVVEDGDTERPRDRTAGEVGKPEDRPVEPDPG